MVGHPDHLPAYRRQNLGGQNDVVGAQVRACVELQHRTALAEHVMVEGDHLATKDIVVQGGGPNLGRDPGGPAGYVRGNVEAHADAALLRVTAEHQKRGVHVTLDHEVQPRADRLTDLTLRPAGQVGPGHGAGEGAVLVARLPPHQVAEPEAAVLPLGEPHQGVVATALAYILFTAALVRLPVSWSATLSLAEPLTASLLGLAVLGESLAPVQLAGAALVAIGLLVLASSRAPS